MVKGGSESKRPSHVACQMLTTVLCYGLVAICATISLKMVVSSGRLRGNCRSGYGRQFVVGIAVALFIGCFTIFLIQSDVFKAADELPYVYTEPHEHVRALPRTESTPKHSGSQGHFYGIMFDAGSTGSRIHVFKFTRTGGYELVDELFEQVKPGLSAFADHPKQGAESLRPMLDKAADYIPKNQWRETPIGLKATAGLRLLSNETAQQILDEVTSLFRSYHFKMSDKSVSILEGTDEGLFCWFTVNFLHGFLRNSSSVLGVLDLGGGSTQITFHLPTKLDFQDNDRKGRIVAANVFGNNFTLYSYSYLGLGLNSGRFQALGGRATSGGVEPGVFHSTCLPTNYNDTWKHGGKEHILRGLPSTSSSRFDDCYSVVRKVIKSSNVDQPEEIKTTTFYALSYYVDRASDVNLIDADDHVGGGKLTVQEFYNAAQKECSTVSKDDVFTCLDLCFISALLHDGLGLHKTSTLLLRKQIRDIEIAWPLGAMFDVYGQFRRKALF